MSPSPKGYSHGPYGTPPKTMRVWGGFVKGKLYRNRGFVAIYRTKAAAEGWPEVRPVTLVWEDQK